MSRFKPLQYEHVAASMVENKAKIRFKPANTGGATSYINGAISCAVCETTHALHGRLGEARPDYEFVCRQCKIKNLCGTITFGSHN